MHLSRFKTIFRLYGINHAQLNTAEHAVLDYKFSFKPKNRADI